MSSQMSPVEAQTPIDGIHQSGLREVIKFRGGHEVGAYTVRLVHFFEEEERPALAPSPLCGDTERRTLSISRERALIKNQVCQHLDLGPSASRTERNKCLLFKHLSLRCFVIGTKMD